MKTFSLSVILLGGLFLATGCGHLDLKPDGEGDSVLTGTVNFHTSEPLPPDTVVTVRLLDTSSLSGSPLQLGEQTINHPDGPPVPFRIEYSATDAQLRHGLNIEARVSYGGTVRFYNVNGYALTLAKVADPHEVWVNQAGKP